MNRITRLAARILLTLPIAGVAGLSTIAAGQPTGAHAAASVAAQIGHYCLPDDEGFSWNANVDNATGGTVLAQLYVDGELVHERPISAEHWFMPSYQTQAEGTSTTAEIYVDGVLLDSETVAPVDCVADPVAVPTATIDIVCPTPGGPYAGAQLVYTLTSSGGSSTFHVVSQDGSSTEVVVDSTTTVIGDDVANGDIIDVWVTSGNTVLASMIDTVNCPPVLESENPQPTATTAPSEESAAAGSLPVTGSSSYVGVFAAVVFTAGLALVRAGRRARG